MDVKIDFLNGYIEDEVYAKQPHDFEDHILPNHTFKLKN